MKKLCILLIIALCMGLLAGCMGTPVVYYNDCTCPTGGSTASTQGSQPVVPGGVTALKTGLAIVASAKDSTAGEAKYDVTLAAVLVDDDGIIHDCVIDSLGTSVAFDADGRITTDLTAEPQTKNELGDSYGMVAYAQAIAEWYEQAQALADFATGKTLEELKNGAIDESGYAPDGTDLASSATIYLGGYVSAIEKAVGNAQHLGAQAGDSLKLASINSLSSSSDAGENDGVAQLNMDVTALTMNGDTISSCYIDSLQAKISFSAAGEITSDLTAALQTKNELGDSYGMVAYAQAIGEWYEQAASFAGYVTGKTVDEVMGIAVDEGTKPTEADLVSSVTIAIGGFQALIQKAAQ